MIPLINTTRKSPISTLNLRFRISTTHHGYRFLGSDLRDTETPYTEIEIKKRTVLKSRKNQKRTRKYLQNYHPSPSPSRYLSKNDDSSGRDAYTQHTYKTIEPPIQASFRLARSLPSAPRFFFLFLKIKRLVSYAT
jgi:hypothetical protein